MKTTPAMLTLTELVNAYPSGVYSARHGCYYFLDQDGELGYFIKYINEGFEPEAQYVDIDTLEEDHAEECKLIAARLTVSRVPAEEVPTN